MDEQLRNINASRIKSNVKDTCVTLYYPISVVIEGPIPLLEEKGAQKCLNNKPQASAWGFSKHNLVLSLNIIFNHGSLIIGQTNNNC